MPTGVFPRNKYKMRTCFKEKQVPWNKGIKWSRKKPSKPMSAEWRHKMSLARIGKTPWNKGMVGLKSHSWKGTSTLTESVRSSESYRKWRADVYKRDGWTCQTCGFRGHGRDIEAHHIIALKELLKEAHILSGSHEDKYIFAMSIPKMFDISNGITLCKDCHILTYKGEVK